MDTNGEGKQNFLQLPETLAELLSQLVDVGLSFVNQLLLQGQYLVAWGYWRFWGWDGPTGQWLGSRALVEGPACPCAPSPGDTASRNPVPLSERMLGCERVLSKAPPSSPGIKMNSYEVLPPAVDRKRLLKGESVLGSTPRVGRKEPGPRCLSFPSSTSTQVRPPEGLRQLSVAWRPQKDWLGTPRPLPSAGCLPASPGH